MGRENSGPGFLAGLLVGGLIGAALGLLMAPQPGRQTRQALRERGIELPQRVDDIVVTAREAASDLRTVGRAFVETKRQQFQDAISEGKRVAAATQAELEREFADRTSPNDPTPGSPTGRTGTGSDS